MYRAQRTDAATEGLALMRVWGDNLPVTVPVADKLRWQYTENPSGAAEAFLLRAGDLAVGCAGITVRELAYAGHDVRTALLADFAVDKAHRTGFPALVLQRAVKRHVDAAYQLSYGFPNANAVAIHHRIGYQELGKMARYVRVLRHGAYLEKAYGRPLATRVAGAALDQAKLAVRLARTLRPARKNRLAWLTDVDARFDRLWRSARHTLGIACRRDAAFLRWRCLREPGHPTTVAAMTDRATGELRAYAMIRGGAGEPAHVVDLLGLDVGALGDLLTLLAPALYQRGHSAIVVRFLGDPRIPALLRAHHFALRDAQRMVIVHAGTGCPIPAVTLTDATAWYLTDLDEDT